MRQRAEAKRDQTKHAEYKRLWRLRNIDHIRAYDRAAKRRKAAENRADPVKWAAVLAAKRSSYSRNRQRILAERKAYRAQRLRA